MSTLVEEFERVQRRRRRFGLLVGLAIVTGVGAWLTGPVGVVMLSSGNPVGWILVGVGAALLAAMIVAIVAAARIRVVPQSLPGAANPHFDEPEPSPDPRGGFTSLPSAFGPR
jgi:NO-binding membrane sensor protein with MHYT domain